MDQNVKTVDSEEIHALIENSKMQGHFWRMLSLVQIPIVLAATISFVIMYFRSDPVLNSPDELPPGEYQASRLPDKEFINIAQEFVNLIGTFQPHTARDQFESARMLVSEEVDEQFDKLLVEMELATAEESFISQLLNIDSSLTSVSRNGDDIEVCLFGYRQRIVEKTILPQQDLTTCVTMATGEPTPESKYGILITDFNFEFGKLLTGVKPQKRVEAAKTPTSKRAKPRARKRRKR